MNQLSSKAQKAIWGIPEAFPGVSAGKQDRKISLIIHSYIKRCIQSIWNVHFPQYSLDSVEKTSFSAFCVTLTVNLRVTFLECFEALWYTIKMLLFMRINIYVKWDKTSKIRSFFLYNAKRQKRYFVTVTVTLTVTLTVTVTVKNRAYICFLILFNLLRFWKKDSLFSLVLSFLSCDLL